MPMKYVFENKGYFNLLNLYDESFYLKKCSKIGHAILYCFVLILIGYDIIIYYQ